MKKINLALQGGGSHGALTWGVIDRLLEDETIEIEAISGASAGAVNAAALAYGLHKGGRECARETLDELWEAIVSYGAFFSPVKRSPFDAATSDYGLEESFSYHLFDAFTRLYSPYQFNPFNINPLRDILKKLIDFDALRDCKRTMLFVAATNVRTGKVHVFETKDMALDVILASTCLPFLFKAVEIDCEHYWDGGYMGNPVLFPFIYSAETRDVLIVHVNPIERQKLPVTAPEIMNRINEISFNSSLLRELRAISFVHKLLDEGWLKDEHANRLRNMHVHSIRTDELAEDLSVASKFNVDKKFIQALKLRGRNCAHEWLNKNYDSLGVRSSVDIRAMFDGG
ncbi:MAG: patatin-like phospholipase family protein [Parvularculaceae bacterium]